MARSGDIRVSGRLVGAIDITMYEEGIGMPPQGSVGFPKIDVHPKDESPGGGDDDGSGTGTHGGGYHGPTFRPGIHQHLHEKAGRPDAGHPIPERRHQGPTFRPGLRPRGKAPAEAPEHYTTADVHAAVAGGRNLKDERARYMEELRNNPALRDKVMRIAANEQGSHPQGTQAIIESMMNRAALRGTTLEKQARWHRSEGGYYAEGNMGRGALENPVHRAVLERSLAAAGGGSNISNMATDNSSGSLAARERATGKFRFRSTYGGETFFSPGSAEAKLAKDYDKYEKHAGGAPVGATRLGAGQEEAESSAPSSAPGKAAPSVTRATTTGSQPEAFIIHHTGGRSDPRSTVEDWRAHRPGVGSTYIMDREGNIHDVKKEFGYGGHSSILPESSSQVRRHQNVLGAGHPELTGRNTDSIEVIARDDADMTPTQRANVKRFVRENYNTTPVFGHSDVNPGHRTNEGSQLAREIRAERANATVAHSGTKWNMARRGVEGRDQIPPGQSNPPAGYASLSYEAKNPERFVVEEKDVGWVKRTNEADLDVQRRRFGSEMRDPKVRQRLFSSVMAETGALSEKAQQAYMETIFNRASARNQTILQTINQPGYYPKTTTSKLDTPVNPADANRLADMYSNVHGGSNLSKMATGNVSAPWPGSAAFKSGSDIGYGPSGSTKIATRRP